jgi:hypothetical protein
MSRTGAAEAAGSMQLDGHVAAAAEAKLKFADKRVLLDFALRVPPV